MTGFVRKHAVTIVVAAVTAGVMAGAPAIAALVNADKLDGRDGVGCLSGRARRAGAYVATCRLGPRAGFLPNSLIQKAPNADRLDGRDSTKFDDDAKGMSEDPLGGDLGMTTAFQQVIDLSIGSGTSETNRLVLRHPSVIMGTASLNFYTATATASEVQCRMVVTREGGTAEVISQVAQAKFPATSLFDSQIPITGSSFRNPGIYDLAVECRGSVGDLRYARGDLIGWAI